MIALLQTPCFARRGWNSEDGMQLPGHAARLRAEMCPRKGARDQSTGMVWMRNLPCSRAARSSDGPWFVPVAGAGSFSSRTSQRACRVFPFMSMRSLSSRIATCGVTKQQVPSKRVECFDGLWKPVVQTQTAFENLEAHAYAATGLTVVGSLP